MSVIHKIICRTIGEYSSKKNILLSCTWRSNLICSSKLPKIQSVGTLTGKAPKLLQEDDRIEHEFQDLKRAETINSHKIYVDFSAGNQESLQSIDIQESEFQNSKHLPYKWQARNKTNCLSPEIWMKLSKMRLSGLVVMTSIAGYVLAPMPFDISRFLSCAMGTALVSASANSFNQFLEIPYDSQMARTKNRVLVQYIISPLQAITFAVASGSLGLATLYYGVNGLCASLGLFNLILYSFIYTPMKRLSTLNTWLGSLVGAVPPLMGWAGCTGTLEPGALVLAAVLYSWQFPHFNSLSWNLRGEYSRAGYRMTCVLEPDRCKNAAFNHSLYVTGVSIAAPLFDVTTWIFSAASLPLNVYLILLSYKFKENADSKSSRKLFRYTLIHLPLLMGLMLLTKKGNIEKL